MQQQFTFAQSRRFRLRTKSVRYFRNGEERGFYRGDARFRVQFSGTRHDLPLCLRFRGL